MRSKTNSLIILFLLLSGLAWCQQNLLNLKFRSIGANEGLSQNSVWDALQTQDGFMWIGTSDGLNRYDGTNFKVYRHEAGNPCSITGQNFPRLYEDKNKQLWVSDDHGLSVYLKAQDCFKTVFLLKKAPMEFYSNSFLGEDNNNGLVVIMGDGVILRIDIVSHKITKTAGIKIPAEIIRFDLTNSPVLIGKTAFQSVDNYYLLKCDLESLDVKFIKHPIYLGKAVIQYSSNELLYLFKDSVCIYNILSDSRRYQKYRTEFPIPVDYAPAHVLKYKNRFWYSSKLGLLVFDPKEMKVVQNFKTFAEAYNEDYNLVTACRTDLSGNLWVCTNGDGVKLLSPEMNKFEHYRTNSKKNNLIKAICRTQTGKIYTTSFKGQIMEFDENKGNFRELNLMKPEALAGGSVTCIYPISENRIAFVLSNSLYLFDSKTEKTEILINEITDPFFAKTPGAFSSYSNIIKIANRVFILNLGKQILELHFSETGQMKYRSIFTFEKFPSTALQFDASGKLWIGTIHGIIVLDTLTKQTKPLLNGVYIKSILTHSNKDVYIATQTGVYQFRNYKQINCFTPKNGLPSDFSYGLLEDNNHHIWISHNKGLSCFEPNTLKFRNFTLEDGLQANEFNTGAYFKDSNGKLYFGGINGFNAFFPLKIFFNARSPKVELTEIKLFEEVLQRDSNICSLKQLKLPYDSNTISFDFAALEFSNPGLIQYAYKLDGYDKDWIYSGNKHYARYANLPFGNYVFLLKAANSDGVWSISPKELSIQISPPYWRTLPFYLLIVFISLLLIGALIYLLIRQQQIKQKRKDEIQANLENERLRIARDLHDHVGGQLSYLITNIDWMLENPDALNEEEANKRLSSLSETGKQAMLTLRQTIWAINNKALSVEDFADRFKQFMIKMLEFNRNIHLEVEEEIDETNMLSPGIALNLFRVCQEAFNNCLKHSDCKVLKVVFRSSASLKFYFLIADDGVGFEPPNANKKDHYGLQNMNARAAESGATLIIESSPGSGTRLSISLK